MSAKRTKTILDLNVESLRFLGDRILLKVQESSNYGSFFIPEGNQSRSALGEVVAIGDGKSMIGKEQIEIGVKPGDEVLYFKPNTPNNEIRIGEEKFILISYSDIIAVEEK